MTTNLEQASNQWLHLDETTYYNKVYGGWLGKNIGGTLGGPVEGLMARLDLKFYPRLPNGPASNDDLDLQLVWLHALEQYGVRLTSQELGQAWLEHVFFPFDEYGYALANLRRGLRPPVSGSFNNPFTNCMGSPIRSEIWAMIAPGLPKLAAYYAYQDAIVDHAGGEGVWGEMFFAALESATFLTSDPHWLIETGLACIPAECRVAQAVRSTLEWHAEGRNLAEIRQLILEHYGHPNFTDAPQNIAFTLVGWLYGEDFGDALLKAVNCGYDTDCTGATLGAILGLIAGKDGLPLKWVRPVGDQIVVSPEVKGLRVPRDLTELTERTMRIAQEVLTVWQAPVSIGSSATLTNFEPVIQSAFDRIDLTALWQNDVQHNRYRLPSGVRAFPQMEVSLSYGSTGPTIIPDQPKTLYFNLKNCSTAVWEGQLALSLPAGWPLAPSLTASLSPGESLDWPVIVQIGSTEMSPFYELGLNLKRFHNGVVWQTERIEFGLIAATHWQVYGPEQAGPGKELWLPGNRLNLTEATGSQAAGVYRATTTLSNPRQQEVRLIVATAAPVSLKLDGKTLFDDVQPALFMPAFHRAVRGRFKELTLGTGQHELELAVSKLQPGPDTLEVYVLPVATNATTAGNYYYLTDISFI